MPVLNEYKQFDGRHWETGSVHNVYAFSDVRAPHTDRPYSESLLLGVSGGITFGYFVFAYEGYDPQCNILTRNTFAPFDRMLNRLGVEQELRHTASSDRSVKQLVATLEAGAPAIVWADMWSLPYNALDPDEGMWCSFPIVVYGYDAASDVVHIADRSTAHLRVTVEELATARGRIKKDKHRLLTLDAPDPEKLASAVVQGIDDCVKLFTEKPPRGTANNFGLQAYRHLAKSLSETKGRSSWSKQFPRGAPMYAGLTSAFHFAGIFGKGLVFDAERGLYAEFLREAAVILDKPALRQVAEVFDTSASLWRALPEIILPDRVTVLSESRRLMARRHRAFLERGSAALEEIQTINAELKALREAVREDVPPTDAEAIALREEIAAQVMQIHDAEREAIEALKMAL